MTDKQYPPLPKPAYNIRQPTRFRRAGEKTCLTVVFTADQMRAYVDADRAQRLIPVDAPCIELKNIPLEEVEAYRRALEAYYGVKIFRTTSQGVE